MRTVRGMTALAAIVLVALVGCTAGEPTSDPAPVHHPRAEVPTDRPAEQVTAGLRWLDPCALLRQGRDAALGGTLEARGPHRCRLTPRRSAFPIDVVLGAPLDREERYQWKLLELGGAKGYLDVSAGMCRLAVPVSFSKAVEFRTDSPAADCASVRTAATGAMAELQNLSGTGSNQQLADWDACLALTEILRGGFGEIGSPEFGEFTEGIDMCRDSISGYTLNIEYGSDPGLEAEGAGKRILPLGGKQVSAYDSGQCTLSWSQGALLDEDGRGEAGNNARDDRVVRVTLTPGNRPCATSGPLVSKAVSVLDGPPPDTAATSIRTLTYRMDEPDIAAPGACADVPTEADYCEPYHRIQVPNGKDDVVRSAKADPNTQCAIALDAVRARFGDGMAPVTATGTDEAVEPDRPRCLFVEPTHSTVLGVQLGLTAEDAPYSESEATPQTVAGRRATTTDLSACCDSTPGRGISIPLGQTPQDGTLRIWLQLNPPRGGNPAEEPNMALLEQLTPLATDIVQRRLGR